MMFNFLHLSTMQCKNKCLKTLEYSRGVIFKKNNIHYHFCNKFCTLVCHMHTRVFVWNLKHLCRIRTNLNVVVITVFLPTFDA